MTTAISINFVISVLALAYGSYVSIKHMHALEPKKRTPPTDFWLLSVGMIGWSIFGLMSFTAIIDYPEWMYDDKWAGNWGYTTARIFMFIFWDNSNIHISGLKAMKQKEPDQLKELFRTNFKNLFELVRNNREVESAYLSGSIPPPNNALFTLPAIWTS